ncbi:MAG: hypothetical protein OXQ84_14960 [bacterium]|nr:hypothetical protein [bacterium]
MAGDIVATLGPQGTCSEIVLHESLHRFRKPVGYRLFGTYELAAAAVRRREAAFLFVAAAFPGLNLLIFDSKMPLRIVDCFLADTPSLVVATQARAPSPPQTIAAVDAPVPMVRAAFPDTAVVPARSNAHAAVLVASGKADAGLTTAPAAATHELSIVRSFGSVPMAWVLLALPPEQAG